MAGWLLAVLASGPATLAGAASGRPLVLDKVPASVAIEAVMKRVSNEPFVLCDAVLQDKRLVSLRLQPSQLNLRTFAPIFAQYGYRISLRGGVLTVCNANNSVVQPSPVMASAGPPAYAPVSASQSVPSGSPVAAPTIPPQGVPAPPVGEYGGYGGRRFEPIVTVSFQPRYGDARTIVGAVDALDLGGKALVVDGAGSLPSLFFSGPEEAVARFKEVARVLDEPPVMVDVQAILLEVTTSRSSSAGVSFIGSMLSGKLGLDVIGDASSNRLSIKAGGLQAILSALGGDSRVTVLSAPLLSGRANEKLRVSIGESVPTLSAIVQNTVGSVSQSVQYRDSGVILEVTAKPSRDRLALDLRQEVSSFAQTRFGVQGSPTLSKRELVSVVDLADGEWIVLGGLTARNDGSGSTRFLGLPIGKTRDTSTRDLVLLISARRRVLPAVPTQEARGATPAQGDRQ